MRDKLHDAQPALDRLRRAVQPSTPSRANYGFPVEITQKDARAILDAFDALILLVGVSGVEPPIGERPTANRDHNANKRREK